MQAHFEGWWGQDYEWAVRVEVWAGVKSGKSLNLKVRDWGFIWQKGTVFKARCDGMMGVFWEGNSENWTIHTGGNCGNEVNYEVVVCVHVCVCVCVCVCTCDTGLRDFMKEKSEDLATELGRRKQWVKMPAMNTGLLGSFWIMIFSGYMPRSGIAGSYGSSIFRVFFLKEPPYYSP